MAARRALNEITCPACGHHFTLEESITEQLEQQWRARERAALRKELAAEVDEKAAAKAQRLAQADVRAAREEVRERDRRISNLQGQITRLQKRIPDPRAQELGVERQQTLADLLHERFPEDTIEVVRRGVAGADVRQTVRAAGAASGSILWESKRAAAWSASWVKKLAGDLRHGGDAVGVIVSDVLPEEDQVLLQLGSVWACTLDAAVALAGALRQGIIQVSGARAAAARRDDLKGRVYDYLTGPEFGARIGSVVRTATAIRADVETERRAFTARWTTREHQAEAIVEDLAVIYGDLRGIGTALGPVEQLELAACPKALPAAVSATASRRRPARPRAVGA
jgi:hypothetical protein